MTPSPEASAALAPPAVAAATGKPSALSRPLAFLFAATCGLLVAGNYLAQPLTLAIGRDIGLSPEHAGLFVTLAQLGYCAGILLLTPLGDAFENRRLVLVTIGGSVLALATAAAAPNGAVILVASFFIGMTASAAQILVPLASQMVEPARRGRMIGQITSGLLLGILLARPVSSFVAGSFGWRSVFAAASVLTAMTLIVLWRHLPRLKPSGGRLLFVSPWPLFAAHPVLRQRALSQAALFASFSLYWTAVPWLLVRDHGFTQQGIAAFALAAAGGALVAPMAGRLADRGHARSMSIAAAVCVTLAFAACIGGGPLWLLLLAALVIDAGVQGAHVMAQRDVLALDAALRNRINSLYIGTFFVGGAAGSAAAGWLFQLGWAEVALAGAALPLVALAAFLLIGAKRRG